MSVLVGYLATAERAVCIADADSFIVYANPAMAELFSAPSYDDIVGKNICDFIETGVDHPHHENALKWMDRIKGEFKETGRVKCRDYNDDTITVDVHHRRFFMVPKIGGGEELYMGCTVTRAEESK
jgi:PAS domain-containing protein